MACSVVFCMSIVLSLTPVTMTTLHYQHFNRRENDTAAFSLLVISMTLIAVASFVLIAFNVDPRTMDDTNSSGVINLSVSGDMSRINPYH